MGPKGQGFEYSASRVMIIEIRSAEGGKHSDFIVEQQLAIYLKLCTKRNL